MPTEDTNLEKKNNDILRHQYCAVNRDNSKQYLKCSDITKIKMAAIKVPGKKEKELFNKVCPK